MFKGGANVGPSLAPDARAATDEHLFKSIARRERAGGEEASET
jgi:hypothetical protein